MRPIIRPRCHGATSRESARADISLAGIIVSSVRPGKEGGEESRRRGAVGSLRNDFSLAPARAKFSGKKNSARGRERKGERGGGERESELQRETRRREEVTLLNATRRTVMCKTRRPRCAI